jgi:hypothetical protein
MYALSASLHRIVVRYLSVYRSIIGSYSPLRSIKSRTCST